MAAGLNAKESTLAVANAETLFEVHPANAPGYHYDVTRDGKRFLVDITKEGNAAPLALVVNWTADLKK